MGSVWRMGSSFSPINDRPGAIGKQGPSASDPTLFGGAIIHVRVTLGRHAGLGFMMLFAELVLSV